MQPDLLTLLSQTNIVIFAIIFTRISGIIATAPMISTYPVPAQIKVWLTALIAFILFPIIASTITFSVPASFPELSVYLLREFGVGFMIGFIANLLFIAVQMSGEFISMQLGLSMSQVLDPATGANSPILSQVFIILISFIFLALNAHHWIFAALYKSFTAFPPGLEFLFSGSVVEHVLHISTLMFSIAISMILPVFCVMIVGEVLMGFVSKMMPQMNIFMVAIPAKVMVGLILILMFLSPITTYLSNTIQEFLQNLIQFMM